MEVQILSKTRGISIAHGVHVLVDSSQNRVTCTQWKSKEIKQRNEADWKKIKR